MLIRTEQTPNPATRKFLPGQPVMEAGTRDFPDADSADASPLARALFDSGLVEGVFYGRDFISVTATPGISWSDLEPLVLETLLDHFVSDAPLFAPGSAAGIHVADDSSFDEDPEDAEIIDQIKELSRPASARRSLRTAGISPTRAIATAGSISRCTAPVPVARPRRSR